MRINLFYCIEYDKDINRIDLIGTHNSIKLVYDQYSSKYKNNTTYSTTIYYIRYNDNTYIIKYFMYKVLNKLKEYFNKSYYSQIDSLDINNIRIIDVYKNIYFILEDGYEHFTIYSAYYYEIRENLNEYIKRNKYI